MAAPLQCRPSISSSSHPKHLFTNPSSHSVNLHHISYSSPSPSPSPSLTLTSRLPLVALSRRKLGFQIYSALQEVSVEENKAEAALDDKRRKLYVVNLPWRLSATDLKNLFGECGSVRDVEIIKGKDGLNRGYAFVTMESPDEARAAIDKFDSYELSGRIIRVEFSKSLKKPSPPTVVPVRKETSHKLYVSNLAWKARSTHLRELIISSSFNPVSARVVFDSPSGRSAGYGFVSFATKEEAEAALSALDGKELLGRPIRLKFSEKNVDESGTEPDDEDNAGGDGQIEEAKVSVDKPDEP
ncbi:hypothetical protein Scep_000725 [Stephania cephalantha]|uniref:RRM domain-containing protein n=1 Tax=Stephania cephalantha TaxID=152367 RepID=A0AAP0Q4E1_9MAGN